jgi:hypothetical protein
MSHNGEADLLTGVEDGPFLPSLVEKEPQREKEAWSVTYSTLLGTYIGTYPLVQYVTDLEFGNIIHMH